MVLTKRSRSRSTKRRGRRVGFKKMRTAKRKGVYGLPRSLASSALKTPYPFRRVCRHQYVENFDLPATATPGFARFYVFSANSIFDPNVTGVGHQPLYRDEMALVYAKYTVIQSYIRVTFFQNDGTQQNFGIVCSKDNILNSNPQTLMEQYGGSRPMNPSLMDKPVTLTKGFNAKRFFGVKSVETLWADDLQRTDRGSSPSSSVHTFYTVWSSPIDGTVALSAAMKCQVKITYVTAWHEPQDPIGS